MSGLWKIKNITTRFLTKLHLLFVNKEHEIFGNFKILDSFQFCDGSVLANCENVTCCYKFVIGALLQNASSINYTVRQILQNAMIAVIVSYNSPQCICQAPTF